MSLIFFFLLKLFAKLTKQVDQVYKQFPTHTKLHSLFIILYLLCYMLTASVPLEWEGQNRPLCSKWLLCWVPNQNVSIPEARNVIL